MAKALQDFVKQAIAPYKYPRAIEFRASLPRTETGKLQRFKLRSTASCMTAIRHKFEQPLRIRFAHCDPAGIVFFPQYLVMVNNLVEDWVTDALGIRYADLLAKRRTGLPTVSLHCEFTAISRMGDEVMMGLGVERLGQKSITLQLGCRLRRRTAHEHPPGAGVHQPGNAPRHRHSGRPARRPSKTSARTEHKEDVDDTSSATTRLGARRRVMPMASRCAAARCSSPA